MLLDPWALGDWKDKGIGVIVSIFLIGVLSIVVGLLYYVLLKKFKTIWIGFAYGLLWWAIVFVVLNPLFPNLKTIESFQLTQLFHPSVFIFYMVYSSDIPFLLKRQSFKQKMNLQIFKRRISSVNVPTYANIFYIMI